jgi:AcrR family transcriptional regulator
MPRIEARNIEEHVRMQTARILDAASALFRERGYRRTDMREIADAVGLARNSLYRYYPNKDHILLACLQRDMTPFLTQIRALEDRFVDPGERVERWLDLQMAIAASACHDTMEMLADVREKSPELRRDISALHEPASRVLATAVAEILAGSGRDARLVSQLIASMLRTAAQLVLNGGDQGSIVAELKASVARVLDDPAGTPPAQSKLSSTGRRGGATTKEMEA